MHGLLVKNFVSFFPNHPVVLGPRFEGTVPRVPLLLLSSSPSSLLPLLAFGLRMFLFRHTLHSVS